MQDFLQGFLSLFLFSLMAKGRGKGTNVKDNEDTNELQVLVTLESGYWRIGKEKPGFIRKSISVRNTQIF